MSESTIFSVMTKLTAQEIDRYKRHLVLREIGGQGQQRFKAARVLVVGAGGLGSPVLMYLAAAGVGTIGVIDDDRVSLDNLQRQIAHDTGRCWGGSTPT
jgi:adenylyltransferase/sulfurtransferase